MLTPQLMEKMSNDHLVVAVSAELDPLTSTPLEIELLGRMETLLDAEDNVRGFTDLQAEYEVTDAEVRAVIESHPGSLKDQAALLSLLNDEDIHEPDQLKELLEFAAKFRSLANDAGDFFTRLNTLITTNQE